MKKSQRNVRPVDEPIDTIFTSSMDMPYDTQIDEAGPVHSEPVSETKLSTLNWQNEDHGVDVEVQPE